MTHTGRSLRELLIDAYRGDVAAQFGVWDHFARTPRGRGRCSPQVALKWLIVAASCGLTQAVESLRRECGANRRVERWVADNRSRIVALAITSNVLATRNGERSNGT